MARMPSEELPRDIVDVVLQVTGYLEQNSQEYAVGGAVALGYWATPRGTVDADITVYLPPDKPDECIDLLRDLGCDFSSTDALVSLGEHGFCRVAHGGFQLDIFLPTIPFYETARERRKQVPLDGGSILIWDAETLCVFKFMFFRLKDLADVEAILHFQRERLDRHWVLERLSEIYGSRDPRITRWVELTEANPV